MNSKNWIKIIVVMIIIYLTFFKKDKFNLTEDDLIFIPVTIESLNNTGSKRSYKMYKIYSKNYSCELLIDKSGAVASDWTINDKLKKNDVIEVGIEKKKIEKLNEETEVRIYSLKKENNYIFNLENYKKERKSRNDRYKILGYISLVLIMFSFIKINKKPEETK